MKSSMVLGVACLAVACSSATPVTVLDSGTQPFTPSNISLSGIDVSTVVDEDLSTDCELDTGTAPTAGGTCLKNPVETIVTQSDGSKIHVLIVKSLKIEPAAHLSVNRPAGGLPLAIIALGDMTVLGTIDVHAIGDQSYGGGFQSTQNSQKGAGPGGGPAATGVGGTTMGAGAGGGSYCGKGGQGALEANAPAPAGAAILRRLLRRPRRMGRLKSFRWWEALRAARALSAQAQEEAPCSWSRSDGFPWAQAATSTSVEAEVSPP